MLACRDDVIVRLVLLQHQPHRLDIVAGVAPVALGIEVAKPQAVRLAGQDLGDAARHLARHEVLAPARGLVVEEDAAARVDPVGRAIDGRHPVRVNLGGRIGAPRVQGRVLVLWRRGRAEHLRGRGLVEAHRDGSRTDRLEQPRRSQAVGVACVLGLVERDVDVALRRQVVDLVGLHVLHEAVEPARVGHVAVVQHQLGAGAMRRVRVLEVVDPRAVHRGAAAHHAVDLVALAEQQLREI